MTDETARPTDEGAPISTAPVDDAAVERALRAGLSDFEIGPSFRYWINDRFGVQAHLGFSGDDDFFNDDVQYLRSRSSPWSVGPTSASRASSTASCGAVRRSWRTCPE